MANDIEATAAPVLPGGPAAGDYCLVLRPGVGTVGVYSYPTLSFGSSGGVVGGSYVAKVTGGIAGHLAVLTSDGSIADGGAVPVGAGTYTLPAATSSVLGGIKQGTNVTIAPDGTTSVNLNSYVQKAASPTAGHYAVLTSDGSIADGGDALLTISNVLDYVVAGGYAGTPAASQRGILHVLPHPITLPAGLGGSVATALTAATSAAVFTLAYVRSGSSTTIATLTFTGTAGAFSSVTIPTLQAGDVITLTAPGTPDATLADIGISILGTKQ